MTGSERRPSVSSSNAVDVVQPVVPFGSVSGVDLSPVVGGCQERGITFTNRFWLTFNTIFILSNSHDGLRASSLR